MNKKYPGLFSLLLLITLLFSACEDKYTEEYLELEPVYMGYKEFREAVKVEPSRELKKPGKIYFKDNYLFINEQMKGIHIYDNANPASPQYLGFVNIPGNVDIAIYNNTLYADSYIDLVAIDLSDMNQIKEISRIKSVFPYSVPTYEAGYRQGKIDDTQGVVIDWTVKKIRKEVEDINYYPVYPIYFANKFTQFTSDALTNGGREGSSTTGIAGSMARFGLNGSNLLAVDNSTYYSFDLTDAQNPTLKSKSGIGGNVETMFLLGNNMFLGTTTGMLIYDISDVTKPYYVANFWHVTGCDPVVVQNNKAYVTIRGGNNCGSTVNRLDVLDVTYLFAPSLIRSYNMVNPYGLGIDDDVLFVCDGTAGLKVYDASDPYLITENLIAKFPDIHAYDVIPLGTSLLMIGEDGFYQYDYSDLTNIKQISSIKINE